MSENIYPMEKECEKCGTHFMVTYKSRNKKFCSPKCRKGYKLSDIAKQHHSEAGKKAHARLHYCVGEKNPNFGKKASPEKLEKMSKGIKQFYIDHPEKKPIGPKNGMYGKKQKPEIIASNAARQKGKHIHTEKHKQELSEKFKKDNPMRNPEMRKKASESLTNLLVGDKNPNWKPKVMLNCKWCGKELPKTPSQAKINRKHGHFCNSKCLHLWWSKNLCKQNHWNWQGGISYEPYCILFDNEFKDRVRIWFGYICVECGTPQNGRNHTVHHVNYDKMMCCNDVKPLFVCLCNSCNGKANFNRPYWEQHFTDMIENYYQGKCYLSKEEMKMFTVVSDDFCLPGSHDIPHNNGPQQIS